MLKIETRLKISCSQYSEIRVQTLRSSELLGQLIDGSKKQCPSAAKTLSFFSIRNKPTWNATLISWKQNKIVEIIGLLLMINLILFLQENCLVESVFTVFRKICENDTTSLNSG